MEKDMRAKLKARTLKQKVSNYRVEKSKRNDRKAPQSNAARFGLNYR